jgi:hypothetical protein
MLLGQNPGGGHERDTGSDELEDPGAFPLLARSLHGETGEGRRTGVSAVNTPDQNPTADLVETLRALSPIPPKPKNLLELIHYAIHRGWGYSLQLVVLAATAALCVATVMFVVQLHPDRWISVVAVAISVITGVGLGRLRRSSDGPSPGPHDHE